MRQHGATACALAVLLGASAAVAIQDGSLRARSDGEVQCKVGEWSDWSECSKACDVGETKRTRKVLVNGENCPHIQEVRLCNEHPCPMDCVLSDWSRWSKCSANCGKGEQQRTRTILSPARYGGKCEPEAETRACNERPCGHVEHGIASIPTWKRDIKCARVDFASQFDTEPLVFATVNHRMASGAVQAHGPATAWVEGATTSSFRVCVGGSETTDDMQIDWLAVDHQPSMAVFLCDAARVQHGLLRLAPLQQDAPTCVTVPFDRAFQAGVAQVWASTTLDPEFKGKEARNADHATRTWVEEVTDAGFRVCAQGANKDTPGDSRATKTGAGMRIAWTAYSGEGQDDARFATSCGNSAHEQGRVALQSWDAGVKCHTHDFERPFERPPVVMHSVSRASPRAFFPDAAVVSWVEEVTETSFRACVYQGGAIGSRDHYYVNFVATPNQRQAVSIPKGGDYPVA